MDLDAPGDLEGRDAALRIRGLKVRIPTRAGIVTALDGVDLSIDRGTTLGLVGESGSGKTMTALAIMGLIPEQGRIADGQIWFEGKDLVGASDEEMTGIRGHRIAMIPQDPMTSLDPVFTIGNQLIETIQNARPMNVEAARDAAISLLEMFGISDASRRLKSYPHQLSGGIRQRVVGAMALAGMPSLLIADEPTTSLDPTIQLQYLNELKRIQSSSGISVLFVTHDFGIVAKVCDWVAVMYAGKVVEQSTVQEILERPAHPYTSALIDSVADPKQTVSLLPTIPGQPPDSLDMPPGCSFAPRCAHAFEDCHIEAPPSFNVADNHTARCWLRSNTLSQ